MRPGDPRTGARYRKLKRWAKSTFPWICIYCGGAIPPRLGLVQTRWDCTLAHDVPVSERPDLALLRSNVAGLAHRGCNRTAYSHEQGRYHAGQADQAGSPRSENW